MLADAHIHLADLALREPGFPEAAAGLAWIGCAASHSAPELAASEALRARLAAAGLQTVASFGIHPQALGWAHAKLLESLALGGRIAAVGEAGFDFFGDRPERVRSAENEGAQRAAFEFQLGLAERAGLPLLLHLRKAMDLAFEYSPRLTRLPAAIFHSYPGTLGEAEALLRRGVDAYFSFGAVIMNGHKRAAEACAALPTERLLAETDAPWQPPRGSAHCSLGDIGRVVAAMASLRGAEAGELEARLEANFRRAYGHAGGAGAEGFAR
jgi:TatD DNase family protein